MNLLISKVRKGRKFIELSRQQRWWLHKSGIETYWMFKFCISIAINDVCNFDDYWQQASSARDRTSNTRKTNSNSNSTLHNEERDNNVHRNNSQWKYLREKIWCFLCPHLCSLSPTSLQIDRVEFHSWVHFPLTNYVNKNLFLFINIVQSWRGEPTTATAHIWDCDTTL